MPIEPRLCLDQDDFPIREGLVRIGRSSRNDIRLQDASVSRLHCFVVRRGDEVRLHDARSENGTRISGAGKDPVVGRLLADGDVVRIGRLRLVYSTGRSPVAAAPAQAPIVAAVAARPPAAPSTAPARALVDRRAVRELALFALPIAAALALAAVGAAVVLGSSNDDPAADETAAAAPTEEAPADLRARIEVLEAELERRGRAESEARATQESLAASAERTEQDRIRLEAERAELARELARIEAENERLAEEARRATAPGAPPQTEAPALPARPEAASPSRTSAAPEARTVERPRPEPPPTLSAEEIDDLAATIRRTVESYAIPSTRPEALDGDLAKLAGDPGEAAARAVVDIFREARDLLAELDHNMEFLEKRNDGLERKASRIGTRPSATSSRGHENQQRLYELSAKKVEILNAQRDRLSPMVDRLLDSIRQLRAPAAADHLLRQYDLDRDPEFRLAILDAIARSKSRAAIPKLIAKLSTGDSDLRAALVGTLRRITGHDAGQTRAEWQSWWIEQNRDA